MRIYIYIIYDFLKGLLLFSSILRGCCSEKLSPALGWRRARLRSGSRCAPARPQGPRRGPAGRGRGTCRAARLAWGVPAVRSPAPGHSRTPRGLFSAPRRLLLLLLLPPSSSSSSSSFSTAALALLTARGRNTAGEREGLDVGGPTRVRRAGPRAHGLSLSPLAPVAGGTAAPTNKEAGGRGGGGTARRRRGGAGGAGGTAEGLEVRPPSWRGRVEGGGLSPGCGGAGAILGPGGERGNGEGGPGSACSLFINMS